MTAEAPISAFFTCLPLCVVGSEEMPLVAASPTNVGAVLKELEADCYLAPSRPNRRGPGFFYRLNAGDV